MWYSWIGLILPSPPFLGRLDWTEPQWTKERHKEVWAKEAKLSATRGVWVWVPDRRCLVPKNQTARQAKESARESISTPRTKPRCGSPPQVRESDQSQFGPGNTGSQSVWALAKFKTGSAQARNKFSRPRRKSQRRTRRARSFSSRSKWQRSE